MDKRPLSDASTTEGDYRQGIAEGLTPNIEVPVSSRKTLILIGAIAVGIFAGIALLNYVRGIEDDIAAEKQSVDVYVAAQDIPEGTPAAEAQRMFVVAQIPLELRPSTFLPIDGEEQITGLVAGGIIPKNQIILSSGQWVNPEVVQRSFVDQIPSGQVAITLQIGQINAVGGYLQPGDEVNLMARHDNLGCGGGDDEEAAEETLGEGEGAEPTDTAGLPLQELDEEVYCTYDSPARYIFQRLEILAIGARQTLAPGQTSTGAITPQGGAITFAVPNEAAQLLASMSADELYLTLLPEDYEAEPLRALTLDVMEGPTPAEIPSCLTPYGPDGFIAGDLVDGADVVADDDDAAPTEHYSCETLWVEDEE